VTRQRRCHTLPQRFADETQSSAEHDDLGMQQVHHVAQGESESLRVVGHDRFREAIASRQRSAEMARLTAGRRFAYESREYRIRVRLHFVADSLVDRRPGATILNDGTSRVEAHMADLDFAGSGAVINLAAVHHPAADSRSHGDVEDGLVLAARAVTRFA
jgi:hypothetical protein